MYLIPGNNWFWNFWVQKRRGSMVYTFGMRDCTSLPYQREHTLTMGPRALQCIIIHCRLQCTTLFNGPRPRCTTLFLVQHSTMGHWFHCCLRSLADPGGRTRHAPTLRNSILSFRHTNFTKCSRLGSPRPPREILDPPLKMDI